MEETDDSLYSLRGDVKENIYKLKTFDKREDVNVYCDELDSQIVLAAESAVNRIRQLELKMLAKVSSYRAGLLKEPPIFAFDQSLEKIQTDQADNLSRAKVIQNLTTEITELEERFSAMEASTRGKDETKEEEKRQLVECMRKTKTLANKQRELTFGNKLMKFEANNELELKTDLIGRFKFSEYVYQGPIEIQLQAHIHCVLTTMSSLLFLPPGHFGNGNIAITSTTLVQIRNIETREKIYTIRNKRSVTCTLLLPNGFLACGLRDGTVNIWDITRLCWEETCLARQYRFAKYIRPRISFMKAIGNMLVVCQEDDEMIVVNPYIDESQSSPPIVIKTVDDGCAIRVLFDSPTWSFCALSNDYMVSCAGLQDIIKVWNPFDKWEMVKRFQSPIRPISRLQVLSNDNILLCAEDRTMGILDLFGEVLLMTLHPDSHQMCARVNFQLPNGLVLSDVVERPGVLQMWNPETGKLVQLLDTNIELEINYVCLSNDGSSLVVLYVHHYMRLWSIKNKED